MTRTTRQQIAATRRARIAQLMANIGANVAWADSTPQVCRVVASWARELASLLTDTKHTKMTTLFIVLALTLAFTIVLRATMRRHDYNSTRHDYRDEP